MCSSVVSHPPVQPASLTLASRFVVISSNSGESSVLISHTVGIVASFARIVLASISARVGSVASVALSGAVYQDVGNTSSMLLVSTVKLSSPVAPSIALTVAVQYTEYRFHTSNPLAQAVSIETR